MSISEDFQIFHEHNRGVYDFIVRQARSLKDIGHRKVGIGMLWEVLRWSRMQTTGEDYKLNNNFRSRYARLIMEQEPDLRGIFDIRELRS